MSLYDKAVVLFINDFKKHVRYENDDLLVINKPAWIPSHRDNQYPQGIFELVKKIKNCESYILPHRLDMPTTGNLLILKNPRLQATFSNANWKMMTQKRYLAIVEGHFDTEGVKDVCLWLNTKGERVKARDYRAGSKPKENEQFAHTIFETLGMYDGYTLVEAQIISGRKHQIRVSLAHLGYPVRGDYLYGEGEPSPYLFLHSSDLKIRRALGENSWIDVTSPLPEHFVKLIN